MKLSSRRQLLKEADITLDKLRREVTKRGSTYSYDPSEVIKISNNISWIANQTLTDVQHRAEKLKETLETLDSNWYDGSTGDNDEPSMRTSVEKSLFDGMLNDVKELDSAIREYAKEITALKKQLGV